MNYAVLPNLVASAVMIATLFYAWRLLRERYLLIWALASAVWMARFVAILIDPSLARPVRLVNVVYTPLRVVMFMVGAAELTGRWPARASWLAIGASVVWGLAARTFVSAQAASMPAWLSAAAGMLWVAYVLAQCGRFGRIERSIAAWSLAVYGLQVAIYPFSFASAGWYGQYMFFVTSVCQLLASMGFLMMCFDGAEREIVSAHEALASALSRVLSGHLVICEKCQSIQTTAGAWERLEVHVGLRSGTRFSHGICEPCLQKHYSDWR
jgi:hypothetical protein